MQRMNKRIKRKFILSRYEKSAKEILSTLVLAGAITIASTSPYFWLNMAKYIIKNKKYFKRKIEERKLAKILEKFKRQHLIILSEHDGKFKIEISEKGRRVVREVKFEKMEIKKPKIWDKKWRVIIFDIPDKFKKRARNALREKLQKLKFYPLQKSVWVCPYPCEKEIQFLCELFDINPFVNIIVAENIYDDIKMKKYFSLF